MYSFYINHIVAPSCSATPGASLVSITSFMPWTFYAYNYTAVSTMPNLIFAFLTSSQSYVYLDSVSVVDNNASSIQLLDNPGFDNSTSSATGWGTWCATAANCNTGFQGQILANSSCRSGNCYFDHCRPNYDYVYQTFPAIIGHIYRISFWVQTTGSFTVKFYANVQNG
jgi:hypothetical protein